MKTKSEVIKLLKEGNHCILVDTNTNVQTDLLREICNELSALGVKTPLNLVFFDSEKTFPYDEIKLSSIQKDEIEPDNEKPNDMRKSISKDVLIEDLNDKRIVGCEMTEGMWSLSRKETAEYLLSKYDITPKEDVNNEKTYLFYEGEKYYFGEEYEFSDDEKIYVTCVFTHFDTEDERKFYGASKEDSGYFRYIRKIDHTSKYKKRFLELKIQAEKDGVNLKELI